MAAVCTLYKAVHPRGNAKIAKAHVKTSAINVFHQFSLGIVFTCAAKWGGGERLQKGKLSNKWANVHYIVELDGWIRI